MTTPRSRNEEGLRSRELGAYRRKFIVGLGFKSTDFPKWREKWANFCKAAKAKGVDTTINFPLYMSKAKTAGLKRPSDIGQTSGKYQMGRKTDSGPYTKSSCRFITMEQNQAERKLNGGTATAVEKAARVRRGQTRGMTSISHRWLRNLAVGPPRRIRTLQTPARNVAAPSRSSLQEAHAIQVKV